MNYTPAETRYKDMKYRRCGKHGLKLPEISLGFWHNFGDVDVFDNFRQVMWKAFDSGVTHFDFANNYGPPPGSAETNAGRILQDDFRNHRDELIISSKAGYEMWPGPYGNGGSRKYLLSSLDQSLKRLQIDYVDIFYSHRPDAETPLEETMGTLNDAVKQGKALYAGVSNYPPELFSEAIRILEKMGTPCIIHQPKYSMFHRLPEDGLLHVLEKSGTGCIAFSPLAQGLLTNKYLKEVPEGSRAQKSHGALKAEQITPEVRAKIQKLNDLAIARNQSLAQMALAWILRNTQVTSVLIGASSVRQLSDNLQSLSNTSFSKEELDKIDSITRS